MYVDQLLVTIQREGTHVTARTNRPPPRQGSVDLPAQEHAYGHLTVPLRQRGLDCTVEYGLSAYTVHAALPDGSSLVISPPQEPPTEHPPGYPESWLVTRHSTEPAVDEVVYDSEPDGPHARHGGSVPSLLDAIDARLDQLGVPPRAEPERSTQANDADTVLHRAGFVPAVAVGGEHHHRLPSDMADPAEKRLVVSLAVDMLHAEGFDVSCDPSLLDSSLPPVLVHGMGLGDRLGFLTESIQSSTHTCEVVATLSELTAPGDSVLQRAVELLDATADWWEGAGGTTDRHYAHRLRSIAENLDSYAIEIRGIRDVLADRHTAHPKARVRADQPSVPAAVPPRVGAAIAASPTASQRTAPAHLPTQSADRPALPPTRPSSAPGR